jgi:16S rRNA G966 N2-methylase RsmD
MIETLAWVLPRPSKSKYIGSFPLHFERKLLNLLGMNEKTHKILHPFGGKAEFGIRCDLNPDLKPDYVCDAHKLPFGDDEFDLVVLDPPYSDELSASLYNTGKLSFKKYTAEAVRVCKPSGYIVMYHRSATPGIAGTKFVKRILIETRVWHQGRIVHIHQKQ